MVFVGGYVGIEIEVEIEVEIEGRGGDDVAVREGDEEEQVRRKVRAQASM